MKISIITAFVIISITIFSCKKRGEQCEYNITYVEVNKGVETNVKTNYGYTCHPCSMSENESYYEDTIYRSGQKYQIHRYTLFNKRDDNKCSR